MAFSPWAQVNKIADIFGVQSEVLRSGAKWSSRWERSTGTVQSQARRVSVSSGSFTYGRTGTNGVMVISRTAAQKIEFYERKAERERRDALKAEAAAVKLQERARKADLRESERLNKAAERELKKAERLMKEAEKARRDAFKDVERENKAIAKSKMFRFENDAERIARLNKAARFVSRQSSAVSRSQFLKVELPEKIAKYAGDIEQYAGGASISINRKSTYIKKLGVNSPGTYKMLARTIKEVGVTAAAMSQGPYKLNELAAMNHPYSANRPSGINRLSKLNPPAGATKKDIINKQSGLLARSWQTHFELTPDGFEASLSNTAPWAWWLAHGTKNMRAHGPWKAAFQMHMPEINKEFAKIALDAQRRYLQQEAEKQVLKTMTSKEKTDTVQRWRKESAMHGMAGGVLQ